MCNDPRHSHRMRFVWIAILASAGFLAIGGKFTVAGRTLSIRDAAPVRS